MPWHIPEIEKCCGCVTDLKTAAAIIAVLGIVTSPAVTWAAIRHSYVVRVSCYISTNEDRPDIVDVNLNNVLSFGFGANAGLGPSCLGPNKKKKVPPEETPPATAFVLSVKYIGWIVLLADLVFLGCSINFLFRLYNGPDDAAGRFFIWAASVSIALSFFYGMIYITACISIGGAFPIFELAFCIIDVLMWGYFIMVVLSYRRKFNPESGTLHRSRTSSHRNI